MKQKVIYYTDELNDEFSSAEIKAKLIDENYRYDGGKCKKLLDFIAYNMLARPLSWCYLKLRYSHKIVNRNLIEPYKKTGYFLYGNHVTTDADAYIPTQIARPSKVSVIVHPNNVSMPFMGRITPYLGAVPLPDTKEAVKNFNECLRKRIENNGVICIFPEAHIWPRYTKIRPFKKDSFGYPIKYNKPVFTFTDTFQKKLIGTKIVTYIDGPFYPDEGLPYIKAKESLRNKAYNAMVKRSKNNTVETIKYVRKDS